MDCSEETRIISLCSGYGGLDLGLSLALPSVRVVAYVEIEAYAIANLVAKTEGGLLDAAPIWTNLETFPGSFFRGKVHGVTAGYPCQPFSVAGLRRGVEDPRHLWPHIQRLVETVRPLFVFLENVPGHVSEGLDSVVSDLHSLGFIVEAGIFSAAEVGAPHIRERLFILGLADTDLFRRHGRAGEFGAGRRPQSANGGRMADTDCQRGPQPERSLSKKRGWALDSSEGVADTDRPAVWNEPGRWNGTGGTRAAFPVGAGEEQHGWEAPRLAQPGLGGPAHGTTCRVDRLRLAGNGVVPQQAELAFRALATRF